MLLLALLVLILLLFYIIDNIAKPKNYPPGPKWLPFTGSLSELKSLSKELGGQHLGLVELGRRYHTDILGLKLGRSLCVVLFRDEFIKEVLRSESFLSRPDSFFIRLRGMGTRKGITMADGEVWITHRNFLIRHLRNLGFGKQTMDKMILDELQDIVNVLSKENSQQVGTVIAPSVLSVLWALVAGERLNRHDGRLKRLLELMEMRSKAFGVAGGLLDSFPWLRFIMPKSIGYEVIVQLNKEMKEFIMQIIKDHHSNWYPGRQDDVIYSFISEMKQSSDSTFTDEQLMMVCVDIFIAGSQTTSNTIDFAILAMIKFPEIQKKIHNLLDEAYKDDSLPQYHNRQLVPYVEAVISEVQRFFHVVPVSGPRVPCTDVKIGPYKIPKDTTILLCNYSVNNDAELWGDPENFRPERFLGPNGQLIQYDHFYPFNIGKRKCLADSLARNCIFTFFTGIMKMYDVALQKGSPEITGIPIPGITLTPEKYTACFKKR